MDAIEKMISSLEALKKKEGELINACVKEIEGGIIRMNTNDQLFNKGITAKGSKIIPPYKPPTIRLKKKTGLPYNRVTLFQTGRFHGKFLIKYGKSWIEITAPKIPIGSYDLTAGLKKRYGDDIFGLTEENLKKVRLQIKERMSRKIIELI